MLGQIIEINMEGCYLSVFRGFLEIKKDKKLCQRIALDSIIAVIGNAYNLTYTNNLLVALAKHKVVVVFCGKNHLPQSMALPIEGNFEQSKRIAAQAQAPLPLKKQVWAKIVQAKLKNSARVLKALNKPFAYLEQLAKKVKSGDSDNCEALGARYYWHELFGKDFRRNQNQDGINALLNYSYTILRSVTARFVISCGLNPSLGIHHCHPQNTMPLIDDLIEPFRAFADCVVYQIVQKGIFEVNAQSKKEIVMLLYKDISSPEGVIPIMIYIQKLAYSLVKIYLKESKKLDFPLEIPMELFLKD